MVRTQALKSMRTILTGAILDPSAHFRNLDIHQTNGKSTTIDVSKDVCSVAFLADGKHVVGGGYGGKVWVWRAADGQEVGTAMNAGSTVLNISVSWDGKWIVVGTGNGRVIVWEAEGREKVAEFQGHGGWVRAVDMSPDMTRVVSGSDDKMVCIWSISSGQRLVGPLEHDYVLAAVKFSQNGDLIATATWWKESIRVYDSWEGHLLVDVPIRVNSYGNQSLAWLPNSTLLLALSFDGDIKCFDVSTRSMRCRWPIYTGGNNVTKCMVVANSGKFVAVSAHSSVFFWDTTTLKQVELVTGHTGTIHSIAISPDYDIATGGGKSITIRSLRDILPSYYVDEVRSLHQEVDVKMKLSR